ncbi:unnamed protein product [Spirodela intermedia]|uniref:K-box domain-containing protein n=1 Tax=Spirodela intermedia TaxID=51605 RepID=A0A7I8KE77_SPIIN|nr:unnamed protein product [Spirodela intermedia]
MSIVILLIYSQASADAILFFFQSMKEIVEKYNICPNNVRKPEQPSLELQLESVKHDSLGKEIAETGQQLKQLKGEDIQDLTLKELVQLEKTLEKGLCRVLEKKGQKIMEEISGLQQKGAKLMEENALLKQQVMEMTKGKEQLALPKSVSIFHDDRQSSGSITSASNSGDTQDCDDSSDTSLKLGEIKTEQEKGK